MLAQSRTLTSPLGYLEQKKENLNNVQTRLVAAQNRCLSLRRQHFIGLTAKLDAMSPLKVLSRGYAMAQLADGNLLRSVKQVKPGDRASVSLADGTLETQILEVKEKSL